MKVSVKTIQKIMQEICKKRDIDGDSLEYATDIERENEYIVRAYDPVGNRSYLVSITKSDKHTCPTFTYSLTIRTGEKLGI